MRWLKNLIRECLYEHQCRQYVEIRCTRDPTEADINATHGSTWENSATLEKWQLQSLSAKWTKIPARCKKELGEKPKEMESNE